MRNKIIVIVSILVLIFSFGLGLYIYRVAESQLWTAAKCPPSIVGVNKIPFEITYKAIVKKIPKGAKILDLWMPFPQNKKSQTITNINIKSPYPYQLNVDPVYGNKIIHTRIKNPKKDFEITLKFSAVREEQLAARFIDQNLYKFKNTGEFDLYLKEDRVGRITPLIKGIANKVAKGDNVIDQEKGIWDYIMGNYQYDFEKKNLPEERGYLPHVCAVLKGRCTELVSLFSGLSRAKNIPAKYVIGFVFKGLPEGKIDGYCCWGNYWASGYGWVPVDPATAKKFPKEQDYYFGNVDEYRIELVEGRDINLVPKQKGKPLNVWVYPYAEIDGKEFEVDKKISWRKEL